MIEKIRLTKREAVEPLNEAIDVQLVQLRANVERLRATSENRKAEKPIDEESEKEGVEELASDMRKVIGGIGALAGAVLAAGIIAPDAVLRANEAAKQFLLEDHPAVFIGGLAAVVAVTGIISEWDNIKDFFKQEKRKKSRE
jgi:hypothetical protein